MQMWLAAQPLVLASRSKVRRTLLEAAGIPVDVVPSSVDERAVAPDGAVPAAADEAILLARAKALAVAEVRRGRIVLGADQTLALGQHQLHKPEGRGGAAKQLRMLRGRSHSLHSAVAVVRDQKVLFEHVATATLTMRNFTDDFLTRYLDAAGDDVVASVGAYQLEGKGSQLFERVDGDYFTVLGLPLLPLLDFFRHEGFVAM
jgi:septum formation protein